jgi:hypothetical protein
MFFFYVVRSHPYPVRKSATCPRANRVCSAAKRDEVFGLKRAHFMATRAHAAQRQNGILSKLAIAARLMFPLTAQKLSRRIVKGMSAGTGCSSANEGLKLRSQGEAALRQRVPEAFRGEP